MTKDGRETEAVKLGIAVGKLTPGRVSPKLPVNQIPGGVTPEGHLYLGETLHI